MNRTNAIWDKLGRHGFRVTSSILGNNLRWCNHGSYSELRTVLATLGLAASGWIAWSHGSSRRHESREIVVQPMTIQ